MINISSCLRYFSQPILFNDFQLGILHVLLQLIIYADETWQSLYPFWIQKEHIF